MKKSRTCLYLLPPFLAIMPPLTSSSSPSSKPKKPSQNPNPNPHISFLCKQHPSPSATLDLLILLLVLFSSLFLISSILSYLSLSFSLLLPSFPLSPRPPLSFIVFFVVFFVAFLVAVEICCGIRGRRCRNPRCQGLKKATEFDVQLQTEECLRIDEAKKATDDLPWKGGVEGNPDYHCLISELRRLAPANGRAVLLFKAKCGCPVAKLEAWGPKRGRKHKKSTGTLAIDNGDR